MDKPDHDIVVLVKSKVKEIATNLNRSYNNVLIEYGLERVLFRLSQSRFRKQFVLKGGMLVAHWSGDPFRFSQDIDLLAFSDDNSESLKEIFSEIFAIEAYDGLEFDLESISVNDIMLKEEYVGKRVKTNFRLDKTKLPISIDIGFGDALPFPDFEIEYPSMLEFAPVRLRAYSPETVIAEKFHTIVRFGSFNTRMKDYYDLWILLNKRGLDEASLKVTIESTFERRDSKLPRTRPPGLSERFATRAHKIKLWSDFSKNTLLANISLAEIVREIWNKLSNLTDC